MLNIHILYIGHDQDSINKITQNINKITVVHDESMALKELSAKPFEGIIVDTSITFELALDFIERISIVKKPLLSLIVSNNFDSAALLRAIRLGISDVIESPIDILQLKSTLQRLNFTILKQQQLAKKNSLLNQYKNALDTSLFITRTNIFGTIIYANDKYTDLTGFSTNEIIGQTHRIFKHPDTPKEQMRELWETIESKRVWHGTIANKTKAGTTFYRDTFIIPILDDQNEIVEYLDMRIDITEIKNYLNIIQQKVNETTTELEAKQQQLIAQSRSAALGEMLDNIAHQWRQPIGAINNAIINAEFALELGNMDLDDVLKTFQQISQYTLFLSRTIDDFRNFSNPNHDSVIFTVHNAIEQTINIIDGAYKMNNIQLVYDSDDTTQIMQICGPQGEFSQVILNILGNSRDAIKEKKIAQGIVTITLNQHEDMIILSMSDNAGGIPEEVLPKIFDPYFTTKSKVEGTGIGLYMSKTIIEKHFNGNIKADNTQQGAIFTISIPSCMS